MKRSFVLLLLALFFGGMSSVGQTMSEANIPIFVCVPQNNIDNSVKELLDNKLTTIVSQNGLASIDYDSRFVFFPVVNIEDIQHTTTPPVMTVVSLQVNLYLVDYYDGTIFASTSMTLKGSGASQEKACLNAVRNLRNNDKIASCLVQGKKKIVSYYDSMCENLLKQANTKASLKEYEEAMWLLFQIPSTSSCFDKSQAAIVELYKRQYAEECSAVIQEAKKDLAIHDVVSALELISLIFPDCPCYDEAQQLYKQAEAAVKELEKKIESERREQRQYESQNEKEFREYYLALRKVELQIQDNNDLKKQNENIINHAFQLAQTRGQNESNNANASINMGQLLKIVNIR